LVGTTGVGVRVFVGVYVLDEVDVGTVLVGVNVWEGVEDGTVAVDVLVFDGVKVLDGVEDGTVGVAVGVGWGTILMSQLLPKCTDNPKDVA
jgi:hypothetical protein